jgi:hypothetical protein
MEARITTRGTIVVAGPSTVTDRRVFASMARAIDGDVNRLECIGDVVSGNVRTVTYARRGVRKVWRTRYGAALVPGMVLRFGNVTGVVVAIGDDGMVRYASPTFAVPRDNAFRVSARQPYRVLVWADGRGHVTL